MPDDPATARRLALDCPSLLDELDHLTGVRLNHVSLELQNADEERLLLSIQREEVVTGTPGEALTGFLFPWDPDRENRDYFHPVARFTSLIELQTWLLDRYA